MKLRNKKTGEIIDLDLIKNQDDGGWLWDSYKTLAELNEDWEDYSPKKPLIKDEKIRKSVRAWAEVNKLEPSDTVDYSRNYYKFGGGYCSIDFKVPVSSLESGTYTIAELCGEEE